MGAQSPSKPQQPLGVQPAPPQLGVVAVSDDGWFDTWDASSSVQMRQPQYCSASTWRRVQKISGRVGAYRTALIASFNATERTLA